jgi:hypothetical protein
MAADSLDICNQALAKIAASPIADMNETSLEARECRRFYPQVISNLLEGPHEWSFSKQRVTLATVTNDRVSEWAYAYQLPSNCASPIRLLPDFSSLGISIPVPLPGEPYAETWAWSSTLAEFAAPYVLDGETIYANDVNATLEYIVSDIANLRVSQMFIQAAILHLAALLAVPVKKDSARAKDMLQQAEVAEQRAIADDENNQPQSYGDYTPETIAARHGIC